MKIVQNPFVTELVVAVNLCFADIHKSSPYDLLYCQFNLFLFEGVKILKFVQRKEKIFGA